MISDLVNIKNRLLKKHSEQKARPDEEYRTGLLAGIEVALSEIDLMLEDESERMARYYGEREDRY